MEEKDIILDQINEEIIKHSLEDINNCRREYTEELSIIKKEINEEYPYMQMK